MRAGVRFDGDRAYVIVVDEAGNVVQEHLLRTDSEQWVECVFGWLAQNVGADLRMVNLDVSALLGPQRRGQVIAVRVAPRPAVDPIHELAVPEEFHSIVRRTLQVSGGHDMRGRVLRDLDLGSIRAALEQVPHDTDMTASITAVGSIANPSHEERVADVILRMFPEARISLSHDFFSTALRDRDFTSISNAALLRAGESLAAQLERVALRLIPGVGLFFGLNDGGRAPIRRLGTTPIHATHAVSALRVQGARHVAGALDGHVVILGPRSSVVGRIHHGVPVARALVDRGRAPGLASNSARVDPYSSSLFAGGLAKGAIVLSHEGGEFTAMGNVDATAETRSDLATLGVAVAPFSSWVDRLERASSAANLQARLSSIEEDLRSQTIHWGADPSRTKVVESNASTFAYGSRHIVRLRVRVIGDWLSARSVAAG